MFKKVVKVFRGGLPKILSILEEVVYDQTYFKDSDLYVGLCKGYGQPSSVLDPDISKSLDGSKG